MHRHGVSHVNPLYLMNWIELDRLVIKSSLAKCKILAAKYVARRPNLVALELSRFKCGHDAPIHTVIEEIVEHSGTPYFCFKDIDENKPTGSIKIRVETIGYFLKRYRENMVREKQKQSSIVEQLAKFEEQVRHELSLAAQYSGKEGGCGTHDPVADLVQLGGLQQHSGEMAEMAGD